jgi:hypothetical protein
MKIILLVLFFLTQNVLAQNHCRQLFSKEIDFKTLLISKKVYENYVKKIRSLHPEISNLFLGRAEVLLLNDRSPLTRERLLRLLDKVSSQTTRADLQAILKEQLTDTVPQGQIASRIKDFLTKNDERSLLRVLGEKTLAETRRLVYGKDPTAPSPESLLGKYLYETKALMESRSYPSAPAQNSPEGPSKSAVGVERSNYEIFAKYFYQVPELLFHYHTPNQGTLLLYFNSEIISYAGSSHNARQDYGIPAAGTLLPLILLSSSEANRMQNYVNLARVNRDFAKVPWEKIPGYSAQGGYVCCTHWFGEMPIGDKLVDTYTFPGNVDRYANQTLTSEPQSQLLVDYTQNPLYLSSLQESSSSGVLTPNLQRMREPALSHEAVALLDKLTRLVWTVPGAQQFADMLGQTTAKHMGEFVNPGYVAYALLGKTTPQRVPIVFHVIESSSWGIPTELSIHAY